MEINPGFATDSASLKLRSTAEDTTTLCLTSLSTVFPSGRLSALWEGGRKFRHGRAPSCHDCSFSLGFAGARFWCSEHLTAASDTF